MEEVTGMTERLPCGEKKKIAIVSLAFFVMLGAWVGVQFGLNALAVRHAPELVQSKAYVWLLSLVPLYLVGLPLCLLVLHRVPVLSAEKHTMTFGQFFVTLLMCFGLMYPLNLFGNILNLIIGALTGHGPENPITSAVASSNPLETLVFAVLIGPVLEELVFRGLIIGRMRRFGDKAAILFSAAVFGLFHGNLYQFFYAFGVGLLFGFIYVRTNRLRYSMGLHVCINFVGSFIPSLLLNKIDRSSMLGSFYFGDTDIQSILDGSFSFDVSSLISVNTLWLLAFMLFSQLVMGMAVAGIILLIKNRRRFICTPGPVQIPQGTYFRTLFLNPGFLVYAAGAFALIVRNIAAG